ncbi:MAG: glycosyltransferase [Candidatus Latescibacterota bacterium]
MHVFWYIAVIGGFVYALFLLILMAALGKVRSGRSSSRPFVSVVMAAHDEKDTVTRCLDALKNQDYDPDLYEVIAADDRSTDGTSELLDAAGEIWPRLRIIHIDHVPEGISPKKNALAGAIRLSQGEIILSTDADCIAPKGWISGMVSRFEPGVAMVTGIAPYNKGPGMLNSFIRHEYLWNAALSAGSIVLGYGTHASGRNIGFRKDIFLALEGYGESAGILSGDDTLLLHRIQRSHLGRVASMPDHTTHVYTEAPVTVSAFFRQRLRHMSTGKYFEPIHLISGGLVYWYYLFLLLSAALSPFIQGLFALFLLSFIWKTLIDCMIALRVHSLFKLDVQWKHFIANELWLLLYMAVIPLAGSLLSVSWKGNKC